MCGFAGFVDPTHRRTGPQMSAVAGRMAATLRHRGPDDGDVWIDEEAGIALGHRRLSVIDLSPAGRQPMVSGDGRLVIAYNGEIYNFQDLRRQLEELGRSFRGRSDTEVILESCAEWGIAATVRRLIGMFAFAVWNREERSLTLARDRIGIKPLYWGRFGELFLFGSELKALAAHPGWRGEVDRDSLAAFLRFNYVPAPRSIFKGVSKLAPGHLLTLRQQQLPVIEKYWDLGGVARRSREERLDIGKDEAVERVESLLMDAVKRRMVADVPLGALLSGGVDSSTVTACMQAQASRPVRTFTVSFPESGYDEATHARAVARHLGTDHTELTVEPGHALNVIPRLPEIYDEPFADSSQIPTFLISEIARRDVTVALSGDGGDEMFLGYNRYFWADALWRRTGRLPLALRRTLGTTLRALSPAAWDRLFRLAPKGIRPRLAGEKMHKLAGALTAADPDAFYHRLLSPWEEASVPVAYASRAGGGILDDPAARETVPDFALRMSFLDTLTYLPDDILTKVDRASMAVSLEVRVPLLDHRLVELLWRIPKSIRMPGGGGDGRSKWLLRQVLYRHVPRELVERPKMGFAVPIDSWLRGPLRDWAEELLDEDRLKAQGYIDPLPVRRAWAAHLSGRRNNQHALWGVLMFQAWNQARQGSVRNRQGGEEEK